MKYRCPYCKHVLGEEPLAICPNCKKGIKIPEHLKESVDKIVEEKEREKPAEEARRKIVLSPGVFVVTSPVLPIMIIILLVAGGILMHVRCKSPEQYPSPAFTDAKTIEERLKKEAFDNTTAEIGNLRLALEVFKRDTGRYPKTEEGLIALINRPGLYAWKGPYVTLIKSDGWKHPYNYSCSNETIRLSSSGPDGIPDTADDIIPPGITEQQRKDWQLE